jgi:hypothetical protein
MWTTTLTYDTKALESAPEGYEIISEILLKIEILKEEDGNGKPVPGFEPPEFLPAESDLVVIKRTWDTHKSAKELVDFIEPYSYITAVLEED